MQDERVDDAKDGNICTNAQSQGENSSHGKAGLLEQGAKAITEILEQVHGTDPLGCLYEASWVPVPRSGSYRFYWESRLLRRCYVFALEIQCSGVNSKTLLLMTLIKLIGADFIGANC